MALLDAQAAGCFGFLLFVLLCGGGFGRRSIEDYLGIIWWELPKRAKTLLRGEPVD
jgi:hypothetical protein